MKAIVIARVSYLSQEDCLSLDVQRRRITQDVYDKKLYVELQKPFDAIYNYNKSGKWGHVVDLFRTKLIQSDLNALIESIRLLMQLVNVKLEIY